MVQLKNEGGGTLRKVVVVAKAASKWSWRLAEDYLSRIFIDEYFSGILFFPLNRLFY
jgi:hypothetical protein